MKQIIDFFDNYFFEIVFLLLIVISFYNGYCNIGIWNDGAWYVLNAIQNSPAIDKTRLISSFLLCFPIYFFNLININNINFINIISVLYGTWFYLLPIIPILFLKFLVPKEQKNYLVFVLCSYLLSMICSSYFISSEIYITTFLYWFILLSILFLDFNKISILKKFILFSVCVITIFSYQIFFIYSLILMSIIILKNFYFEKEKAINIYGYIIFLLLLISAVITFYYTINSHDTNSSKFLSNLYIASISINYMQYVVAVFVLLTIINYKKKYINVLLLLSLIVVIFLFILNNFALLHNAHDSRTLTPVFTLFLSIFLICNIIFFKNIKINFNIAKYIIVILLFVYSLNTFIFNNKINVIFHNCIDIFEKETRIIIPEDYFFEQLTIKDIITDRFVLPRQLILIQLLYSSDKKISKIIYNKDFNKDNDFNATNSQFIKKLNNFGVKYSDSLLEEIDKI